jgi:hypothetical protein
MNIGRKIYYELATGNIILDTGERQGDVMETTQEQDFQAYTALQPYQQNAVGVLQLAFGENQDNFTKYPYHIDITTKQVVWDTANPLGASLADVQAAKIAQIKDLYNQKLEAGFSSSATGTAYTFGYGATDQMKFMQLAIMVMAGKAVFPVTVHTKDNKDVSHDQTQYNQLVSDIAIFAQPLDVKEHDLISRVQACTAVDEVNAIVVSY